MVAAGFVVVADGCGVGQISCHPLGNRFFEFATTTADNLNAAVLQEIDCSLAHVTGQQYGHTLFSESGHDVGFASASGGGVSFSSSMIFLDSSRVKMVKASQCPK